jgi:dTMP kinase
MQSERGLFITFEGGDGSGKSTQIQHVKAHLDSLKVPCLITREPGGTLLAEQIRELLLTGAHNKMDALTEYLLFSAGRRDHVEKVIAPALATGTWVLCDRFYDSSVVYQGFVQGLSPDLMETIYEAIVPESSRPDLTFVFELDPHQGLKRTQNRQKESETRFESKGLDFHQKVQEGFRTVIRNHPERCVALDASQSPAEVFEHLKAELGKYLP